MKKVYHCTGCELSVTNKGNERDSEIKPREGIEESSLDEKWCDTCNTGTLWFLGLGVQWKKGRRKSELSTHKSKFFRIRERSNYLEEEIEKLKIDSSFLSNFLNSNKLLLLEKELDSLMTELEGHIDNISINFWNSYNSVPKCLYCGNQSINKDLIHSCGGTLYYQEEPRIRFNGPINHNPKIIEYDINGNTITYTKGINNNKGHYS
tara:strand:- start:2486 stop:3106 length:621 start_codon:yes stop_codon:yes gene_type:complete